VKAAPECDIGACEEKRNSTMNAITLEPISEALLPTIAATTLEHDANESIGWKSEAQRLAQGARRHTREARQ
jgi:hypothetical protein